MSKVFEEVLENVPESTHLYVKLIDELREHKLALGDGIPLYKKLERLVEMLQKEAKEEIERLETTLKVLCVDHQEEIQRFKKEAAEEFNMNRLYDWLMDENRKPANSAFTAGALRNVAKEIEYRLSR